MTTYAPARYTVSPERTNNPDAYLARLCDHRHRSTRTALECLERIQRRVPGPSNHIPHTIIAELNRHGLITQAHRCEVDYTFCDDCEAWERSTT